MSFIEWLSHVFLHTYGAPNWEFRDMTKRPCNNCWRVKTSFR